MAPSTTLLSISDDKRYRRRVHVKSPDPIRDWNWRGRSLVNTSGIGRGQAYLVDDESLCGRQNAVKGRGVDNAPGNNLGRRGTDSGLR